jgi:predicted transcriptional regulator YheO
MPITWDEAEISPAELSANSELAGFTWSEFSTAYEAYLKRGKYRRKDYQQFYNQHLDKKKKMINLILKVKGKTIKDEAIIPVNMDIALSNIDLVIQEVIKKPSVNIYA